MRWGIKQKLYVTVAALAMAGVVSVVLDQWTLRSLSGELEQAVRGTAVRIDLINSIRASTWEAETYKRGVFLAMSLKNPSLGRSFDAQMETTLGELDAQLRRLRGSLDQEEEQRKFGQMESRSKTYADLIRRFSRAAQAEKLDEIPPLVAQIVPLVEELGRLGDSLAAIERQRLQSAAAQAEATRTRSIWSNGAIAMLLAVCVVVAVRLTRSVGAVLHRATEELADSSRSVNASAREFAGTSNSIAQGSSELAATMEETSAASREAHAAAEANNRAVTEASELANETNRQFDQGSIAWNEMVAAMKDIQASSANIAKIIKVIDEIAFQTSILSLNAAVEAARAGEFGTGFAVVAEEVRNLSDRCARAAKETSQLIEESIARSDRGQSRVGQVSEMVSSARAAVGSMEQLLDRIRQGSAQQKRSIEQISQAIQQVDRVAQLNAAAAEQSSSAATELEAQARTLDSLVDNFSVVVGGASGRG